MNALTNGKHHAMRINSPSALDELIGEQIMKETPEVFWQDTHGLFSFATEVEARNALRDPYYQRFLPDVDWSQTIIRRVKSYRPYTTDLPTAWLAVEKLIPLCGPIRITRVAGTWMAAFGDRPGSRSRSICVAICIAALSSVGHEVVMEADRIH